MQYLFHRMALKRFKTDWRIWLCISLLLFAIPWFIQEPLGKANLMPVALFFNGPETGSWSDPDEAGWRLFFIAFWTVCCGIPAVLVGWVMQAIAVSVRDWMKRG